jgi:hypothetical protein
VRFTLAASSVISADEPVRTHEAAANVAKQICKASRITTEGVLNTADGQVQAGAANIA